jgi:hypothetical protein
MQNYSFTAVIPSGGLTVKPDPFRPASGSVARFSAAAMPGESFYAARIFDIEGRETARLAAGPIGAQAVSFTWDGRDRRGMVAGTGIYICVVEFVRSGGGVCRREKRTIAVWSGE